MITRYAYIVDGETLWGPGPMPYFIKLKDKTMWEITAHTIEESESIGVFVVEQIGYIEDLDQRFYRWNDPGYSIVDGRPREVHTKFFIPAARSNMIKGVDEYAEKLRQIVATMYPGQYQEYDQVYKEAVEVNSLPIDQEILPGTYKFLEADIGVTPYWGEERFISNVREAAVTVANTRDTWNDFGGNLRKARLETKKLIREATSDEQAIEIFNDFCSKKVVNYFTVV